MYEQDMQPFLQESNYCDYNNQEIKTLARGITKGILDDKSRAVVLFCWVRDNIKYRVGLWNKSASETLAEKAGSCTNSANLLVALLRVSGIPAAYNVMRVAGKKFFGPITLPVFRNKISDETVHIFASAYLNGRWVKCDPSTDKVLSEKTGHMNPPSQLVEWDAEHDAVANIHPDHVISETDTMANIDRLIAKKPKTGKGAFVDIANLYINFLRNNEKKFGQPDESERHFRTWLRDNHRRHHYMYLFNMVWHRIKEKFRM